MAALCPVLWGPCTTTPLAAHVAHRVWVAAGRCGADEQGCVPAMAVASYSNLAFKTNRPSSIKALSRNYAVGAPASGPA